MYRTLNFTWFIAFDTEVWYRVAKSAACKIHRAAIRKTYQQTAGKLIYNWYERS